jgi:hypothetical protein
MDPTREEVAKIIDDFISDNIGTYDWDDFISIKITDPELERIRIFCLEVTDLYPSVEDGHYCSDEGINRLRGLADGLRNRLTNR